MLMRSFFGALLSSLLVMPLAAAAPADGRLSAVAVAEDGTTWTVLFDVKGGQISGDVVYDHCQSCPESDGEYYCSAQDIAPEDTYSVICISRTKTVRGDTHVGSESVRVDGNLSHAWVEPGFYPRVEFTLLNERDFRAYQRSNAAGKKTGTDAFAAAHPTERPQTDAAPPDRGSGQQLDRLVEEREKAEATLRELRRQREGWARERAAAEQARRRLQEERAALRQERRRVWEPRYRRGLAAFDKGDYATALSEWRPLADQGHAEAQYRLGRMYEKGWGIAKDRDTALRWYRKAADQGHEQAMKVLRILEIDTNSSTPISF